MSRVSARSTPDRELSVPEMLADPIVQKVMARDGVTKQEVEGLIGSARKKRIGEQPEKLAERDRLRGEHEPSQGTAMSKNSCQCDDCACSTEAGIKAAASMPAVNHNHARLPGILRYRGMVNEAVMAARLVKVESLNANLQSVLDDLDTSMGVRVTPGSGADPEGDNRGNDAPGRDARTFARRHAQFLEGMLETALSKIRAGVASSDGHPMRESERRFDEHVRDTT